MPRDPTPIAVNRVAALQTYRERLFRESLLALRERPSERDYAPWDEEVPLLWSLIGLTSGIGSIYPGTAKLPEGYDPRTRPWYQRAIGAPSRTGGHR